jgi:hypothetical protein
MKALPYFYTFSLIFLNCSQQPQEVKSTMFKDDIAFLNTQTNIIVLSDSTGKAQVAVSPAMQGRVLTSSADGPDGISYGWINRELIASHKNNKQINAYGGEDRFWLGPEGGQYAIYFEKGKPFTYENWATPPPINEEPYDIVELVSDRVVFRKQMTIKNYSDFQFQVQVDREIRLLKSDQVAEILGLPIPVTCRMVAFQSDNRITNISSTPWKKETGLLSIWILGMFNPSPATTVVIPFRQGSAEELGPIVNDTYFGKVPSERLIVRDNVLFFKCDGEYRSKIGLSPHRCKPFAGSYDAANRILTLVLYTFDPDAADYVNSMWELQNEPFKGDVVNSYNDGPPAPGVKPMGPFYELETSSAAAALQPGTRMQHIHRTFHFQDSEKELDKIALAALGVGIEEIKNAMK